jgi:hypothetical protein
MDKESLVRIAAWGIAELQIGSKGDYMSLVDAMERVRLVFSVIGPSLKVERKTEEERSTPPTT